MRVQFNVKFISFLAYSSRYITYFCLWNSNGLIHFNMCVSQYRLCTLWQSYEPLCLSGYKNAAEYK
jgi:hypothetical protein